MRRSDSPTISVVITARNVARGLEILLPSIASVRPVVNEVVVVDGHSTDGTIETARRVLPSARIVTQTRIGKGNAMVCGFSAATGDIIVTMESDGVVRSRRGPILCSRAS